MCIDSFYRRFSASRWWGALLPLDKVSFLILTFLRAVLSFQLKDSRLHGPRRVSSFGTAPWALVCNNIGLLLLQEIWLGLFSTRGRRDSAFLVVNEIVSLHELAYQEGRCCTVWMVCTSSVDQLLFLACLSICLDGEALFASCNHDLLLA